MSEQKTRVLHIVHKHAMSGGIGTVMDYLMEGLNSLPGFQADTLLTDYDEEARRPRASTLLEAGKRPVEKEQSPNELESLLDSYDVVHVHSYPHAGIMDALYTLRTKGSDLKIVNTAHSSTKVEFLSFMNSISKYPEGTPQHDDYLRYKALYEDDILNNPYKHEDTMWGSAIARQERIMSLSDVVQHMNESYKNQIIEEFSAQCNAHKHIVVPHGIKIEPETTPRPKRKRIMYVGRFSREKGIEEFIDSIPRIFEKHPDAEIKLLGGDKEGKWTEYYKQMLKDKIGEYFKDKPGHNIEDYLSRIQFTGWVSDKNELREHYRWTDYVIVPSTAESFSLAAAEALMHKRIPILTKTPSMDELYISKGLAFGIDQDKRTGEGIAEVVNKILDNDLSPEHDKMAEHGREYVAANYSFESMIARQAAVYKKVINQKGQVNPAQGK